MVSVFYVEEFMRSFLSSRLSEQERRVAELMTDIQVSIGMDSGDGDDHMDISHVCQESCVYPHPVLYISGEVEQRDGRTVRQTFEIDAEDLSLSEMLESFQERIDESFVE